MDPLVVVPRDATDAAQDTRHKTLTAGSCSSVRVKLPRLLLCLAAIAPFGAINAEEGHRPRPQARRVANFIASPCREECERV